MPVIHDIMGTDQMLPNYETPVDPSSAGKMACLDSEFMDCANQCLMDPISQDAAKMWLITQGVKL